MRRFGRIFAASTMLVACARRAYEMLRARRAKEVRGMTGLCSVPCSLFLVIAAFSFHGAAAGGVIIEPGRAEVTLSVNGGGSGGKMPVVNADGTLKVIPRDFMFSVR